MPCAALGVRADDPARAGDAPPLECEPQAATIRPTVKVRRAA
jgi:hypothetical protein